jgi:phosphatidylserine/phosphatidylglycerophosphate/cardiolipin synthase-like enzyme
MYELVENAKHEIILTSFVTYGADNLLTSLHAASQRGVSVKLVLERAEETDGKLSFDGMKKIKAGVPQSAIYFWPLEKRGTSKSGKKGILHVKCLLCDGSHVLVSSANLTDFGLELNMELGLVLHGGEIPARLAKHFTQLIHQGDLRRWE